MHGGILIAFTRILNCRLLLYPRNSEFRCRFLFVCLFFSFNNSSKLTGIVNVARHSVAPQNVIAVGKQMM